MHCYFAIGRALPSSWIGKLAEIQPIVSSVIRWSDCQETWRSFSNFISFLRYWPCTCAVWDLTYPVRKPCNVRSRVTLCGACQRNILAFNNRFVLWSFQYHWISCMKERFENSRRKCIEDQRSAWENRKESGTWETCFEHDDFAKKSQGTTNAKGRGFLSSNFCG